MSRENVKALIERVRTDKEFRNRLQACKDEYALLAVAKAEGFDVSADDIKAVNSVLSGDVLNQVLSWRKLARFMNKKPGMW